MDIYGKKKLKHLIEYLEDVETFSSPKEELEQYQTNAQVAGEMLHYISTNINDFEYMNLVDLGCGTGILGIAASLCGYIDEEALEIAKQNVENLEHCGDIQILQMNCNYLPSRMNKKFDIVLTNPPFGIRSKKSADVSFLKTAINVSSNYIYSLHKFSTFDYLKNFYSKCSVSSVHGFKIQYDIPKTYKFHKQDNKTIEVLCLEANVENLEVIHFTQ